MNKLSRYRKLRYNQLFESENRELRLNEMGNPLEVLSQYVEVSSINSIYPLVSDSRTL